MRHASAPFAAAWLAASSIACTHAAQPVTPLPSVCPVCTGEEPATPPLAAGGLLPDRFVEVSPFVITHATLTKTEPHLRSGAGLEVGVPFMRDGRARWLFSQGLVYGAWGDQRHGNVISESETGFRVSFMPSTLQVVDLYTSVTEGLLVGAGSIPPPGASPQLGNMFGGGVGLRLFRAFAIELSGHWVHAFQNPFVAVDDGSTTPNVPDVALSFGVDVCALGTFCDRAPIPQASDDATCVVYDSAHEVCEAAQKDTSNANARKDLCQHAFDALEIKAGASPILARDAVRTFLSGLETSEGGTPRASRVKTLVDKNTCLEHWRSCGRRRECQLGQLGQSVATRRVYAPYTIELLAALGCTRDGAPAAGACAYTCEDPAPLEQVCQ